MLDWQPRERQDSSRDNSQNATVSPDADVSTQVPSVISEQQGVSQGME